MFTRVGLFGAFGGFVLIGALQALYGPAIPALRAVYDISPATAGLGLSAHFVGGLIGVLAFDRARARAGNRFLLGASYLAMAAGAALFALAPPWPVALTGAFVAGLGYGGIDYGMNQLFTTGFGTRGAAMLNLLNAFFGVGSILAPLLLGVLGPARYAWVFLGFALLSAALVSTLRGVSDRADTGAADVTTALTDVWVRGVAIIGAFVALYVLNIGVESGVGGWEPTHLESVGYTTGAAATATALYWLMMTVGRFVVVPLALRWSEPAILVGSCVGMAICLALAVIPELAPIAYAGVGLFIAPVFPTGLPWLHRAVPHAKRATAFVIAASMVGGVLFPPLLGLAIDWQGTAVVPPVLFGLNAVCLALVWYLVRTVRAFPSRTGAGRSR